MMDQLDGQKLSVSTVGSTCSCLKSTFSGEVTISSAMSASVSAGSISSVPKECVQRVHQLVAVEPGQRAVTRMLYFKRYFCMHSVKPLMANLVEV